LVYWWPIRLLTPALSSFGEERENYFVGRLPRVVAPLQPWANIRSAFSAFKLGKFLSARLWLALHAFSCGKQSVSIRVHPWLRILCVLCVSALKRWRPGRDFISRFGN
jgi:hypothetical protein